MALPANEYGNIDVRRGIPPGCVHIEGKRLTKNYSKEIIEELLENEQSNGLLQFERIERAVEATDPIEVAKFVAEILVEMDDSEMIEEIAADFIEDEVGRFDWQANWAIIKAKENPTAKIQNYLVRYNIDADPDQVAEQIDRMVLENPGRWK